MLRLKPEPTSRSEDSVKRFLTFVAGVLIAAPLWAQTPAAPANGTANAEVDPIRCWWRTSAGGVRTGETFDLVLTCAVLQNDAVEVVPDESRLGSAVIQMAPFEVVGGSHPADLHSGGRRFFQYQYTLRVINPDVIGRDVRIPDIVIHYRINSRVAANQAIQGRDLVYMLPSQSVRVMSLVPGDAGDIRDAQGENFANAEGLKFRASVLNIVAIACIALGALMTLVVIVRLARGSRKRTPRDARQVRTSGLAHAAARELNAVQNDRGHGEWTPELLGRALAATRVAAACAIGAPVSQRIADTGPIGVGRLRVSSLMLGKPRAISASVTAADVARAEARGGADPALEPLREALTAFAAAQYGRNGIGDAGVLDSSLASAVAAAARVKRRHAAWKEPLKQFRNRSQPAESRA
jgi:hypothetical protein